MKRHRWMIALSLAVVAMFAGVAVASGQDETQKPMPPVVRSVSFSPDGKLLAVALEDAEKTGKAMIFDVATRRARFVHHEDTGIRAVAFSPDGRTLAIGQVAPLAKLVEVATGDVIKTFEGHENQVRSVAFSPDGSRLITASHDRTVKIWDIAKGQCQTTLTGHMDIVTSAAMAPDGSIVVSCSHDGTTRVWNPTTDEELQVIKPTQFAVANVAFTADGTCLATSHYDGFVRMRESKTRLLRARIATAGGAECAAFSPNGRTLAAITHTSDVELFEIDLAEPGPELSRKIDGLIARWDDDDFAAREAASAELVKIGMSAESLLRRAMESDSAEMRIRARRAHTAVWSPQARALLKGHSDVVTCIAFSPAEELLASGDKAGTVKLWDIVTGKNLATLSATERTSE